MVFDMYIFSSANQSLCEVELRSFQTAGWFASETPLATVIMAGQPTPPPNVPPLRNKRNKGLLTIGFP